MAFIMYDEITKGRARIRLIHNAPEKLSEEVKSRGMMIESVPEIIPEEGKIGIRFINPETREIWTEYEDLPADDSSMMTKRISELEKASGINTDSPGGVRGIAARLDSLEDRIKALEDR